MTEWPKEDVDTGVKTFDWLLSSDLSSDPRLMILVVNNVLWLEKCEFSKIKSREVIFLGKNKDFRSLN